MLVLAGSALAEGACGAAPPQVRLMLHDPPLLVARLKVVTGAGKSAEARASAVRKLFEAAGCPQLAEQGGDRKRDVVCTVPGASDRIIVVGVNTRYDREPSAALLPSLAEALAAAPRTHTFRWAAFAPHESRAQDRTKATPNPKGANRLLAEMSEAERARVAAMIHVGPVGFGDIAQHPSGADARLDCALESAVGAAGLAFIPSRKGEGVCRGARKDPNAVIPAGECPEEALRSGGNDWQPFRAAGIPVFGIHSGRDDQMGARLDAAQYVKSYRMLAVFLALADEALSSPASAEGTTSPR
jgi:hypothetical protein